MYNINGTKLAHLDDARRQAIGEINWPRKDRVEIMQGSDEEGWTLAEWVERGPEGFSVPSWV